MRLFYALWPDEQSTARLSVALASVDGVERMRLVPRGDYHVTLVFVGEVAESRLVDLRRIGRGVRGFACALTFDALEYWPEPAVVVATMGSTPPALTELCRRLNSELAAVEWIKHTAAEAAARPTLRAHVTLARKVLQPPVLQAMSVFSWPACAFSLVRSDRVGERPVYTVVDTWPLLYETPKP